MRCCVLDTETTGLDPEVHGVVEYAHCVVDTETRRVTGHASRLVHPGPGRLPIPPEARAVHHIADDQVASAPPLAEVLELLDWSNIDIFVAHNSSFDRGFLPMLPERPWVDTLRCAKHLWPDAPQYGLQVLRYWREIEPAWPVAHERPEGPEWVPHRALYDVCTTASLLLDLLETARSVMDRNTAAHHLVWLTEQPVLLKMCWFGKHRGVPWEDVPVDYLDWMARTGAQMDDEDTAHTVNHYRRRA